VGQAIGYLAVLRQRGFVALAKGHWQELLLVIVWAILALSWNWGESLWWDEGCSVAYTELPLSDIPYEVSRIDIHPPGYYILLTLWAQVSMSPLWLKMLSLALYSGAVLGTYMSANELWRNRPKATLTAGLVAISPLAFYSSHEIRMYAMLLFGAAWTFYLLLRFERRRELSIGALLALSSAVTLSAHYYGIVLICSLLVLVLVLTKASAKERLVSAAPMVLGAAAFMAFWWEHMLYEMEHSIASATLSAYTLPLGLAQVFGYPLRINMSTADRAGAVLLAYAIICIALLTRPALARMLRARVVQALIVQFGVFVVAGLFIPGIFNDRFSIVLVPTIALSVAEALDSAGACGRALAVGSRVLVTSRRMARLAVAVLIAVSLASIASTHVENFRNEDWKGMAAYLEVNELPTDTILLPRDTGDRLFDYYIFGYYYDGSTEYAGAIDDPDTLTEDAALEIVQALCEGHPRTWYVTYASSVWDPEGHIEQALEQVYEHREDFAFGNVDLALFF
jgi:uncharacterized membrane protein